MTAAEEQELVEFLERDQLVMDTSRPVSRRVLSRRMRIGLWALRVFIAVITAMVIYTFISQVVH